MEEKIEETNTHETHHEVHHDSRKPLTETLRKNPWILSTFILGIFAVLLIIGSFGSISTGKVISEADAGQIIVKFAEDQTGQEIKLESVTENSGLYEVTVIFQDQPIPLYLTKDGENLVQGLTPLSSIPSPETSESQTPPKTDKPQVDLFVWGYCPYGVQAQGPMAEVASLLEDSADFVIVPYYDGHGAFETQQNKIQLCIQQNNPDKYWNYAAGFAEDIYPKCSQTGDIDCDLTESTTLMNSLGIDSSDILDCVESDGETLFAQASSYASQIGVQGSPTIIINGVKVNVARNAEAIKTAVCDAFTDGNAPSECSNTLDSSSTAASGSC